MDFFEGWDAKRQRGAEPAAAPVAGPVPAGQTTAYALAALQGEVANLQAVAVGHGRNDQLNRSAVKLYGLAAAGQIDERLVTETLGAADGGLDYPATRRTLQSARDAVYTRLGARAVPEPATNTRKDVPPWEQGSDDPFADNFDESLVGGGSTQPTRSSTTAAGPGAGSAGTIGGAPGTVAGATASGVPAADGSTPTGDPDAAYRLLVEAEAKRVRLSRDARRLVDEQDAARAFRVPPALLTLTDELAIPDEPVTFLIDELVPSGANVLLTAQFKTGKTTLVNNLARALVDGERFLDRFVVEPFDGRVVLFNYEVDGRQYRRWLRDVGIHETDRVSVLNLRGFRLPLTVPHVEDWAVDFLRSRDARVWVVDPFARAFVGCGDENDNGEVGVFLDTLDVIKERAGVDVLVMPNHTGRAEFEQGSERGRGATRLDDWADVRWLLTRDKKTGTRYFRATGRDVELDEGALTFDEATRHLTLTGDTRQSEADRQLRAAIVTAIRDLTASSEFASRADVEAYVKGLGVRFANEAFQAAKVELVRGGFIYEHGHSNRGYKYRLGAGSEFDPLA